MGLRRREDLEAREGVDRARLAREGTGSLVYALLVLVSAGLLLGLSARFRHRWDFSALAQNSLSPQSLRVLDGLREDVRILAFFTQRHLQRQDVADLLDLYEGASSRIKVEIIDPVAKPAAVRDLGLPAEEAGRNRDGFLVALRGERRLVFRGVAEEAVTNAILEVGSDRKRVVGFIRGYGEADPASRSGAGMASAADALRNEYYEVRDVYLTDAVPEDVTTLVLAAAHAPIPSSDLDRLAAWLAEGGRLLVLLEPEAGTGLDPVLEPYGIKLGGERLIDPQENLNGRVEFLRITDFRKHPVVEGFGKNLPAILPTPGTVSHFEPVDATVLHDGPARTSRFAVAFSADGTRAQGPFDVAAAAWKRLPGASRGVERETRLFVVGDSDFALNAYLPMAANRNLLLNAVGWLTRSEGLVTIRKPTLSGQILDLRPSDQWVVGLATLGGPTIVLVLGIVVWLRRRGL